MRLWLPVKCAPPAFSCTVVSLQVVLVWLALFDFRSTPLLAADRWPCPGQYPPDDTEIADTYYGTVTLRAFHFPEKKADRTPDESGDLLGIGGGISEAMTEVKNYIERLKGIPPKATFLIRPTSSSSILFRSEGHFTVSLENQRPILNGQESTLDIKPADWRVTVDYERVSAGLALGFLEHPQGWDAELELNPQVALLRGSLHPVLNGTLRISLRKEKDFWLELDLRGSSRTELDRTFDPVLLQPDKLEKPTTPHLGEDSQIRFSDLGGDVTIRRWNPKTGDFDEFMAKLNQPLLWGDEIITSDDSEALLTFPDLSSFTQTSETRIYLPYPYKDESNLQLLWGNIKINAEHMLKYGTMKVEMSQAVMGIKGTVVTCSESRAGSEVRVLEGAVTFTHRRTGENTTLEAGQCQLATRSGFEAVRSFDVDKERTNWAEIERSTPPGSRRTYEHPTGLYTLRIPDDWTIREKQRNRVADPEFDSLVSQDGKLVIIVARKLVATTTPIGTLHTFRAEKEREKREIPDSLTSQMLLLSRVPAVRVGYASKSFCIWRMAAVQQNQRIILNVVAYGHTNSRDFPKAASRILSSLEWASE